MMPIDNLLDHPKIAPMRESGRISTFTLFLTMLFLCHYTLADVVGSNPVSPSEAGYTTTSIIEAGQRGGMLVPVGTNISYEFNQEMGDAMEAWNAHRWQEGVKKLERIYKEHPDSPWAAEAEMHVACFYRFNGMYDEAEDQFISVLKKYKNEDAIKAKVYLHLPDVYYKTGRPRDALATLQKLGELPLNWKKSQFLQNWSLMYHNAISLDDTNRLCGTKGLAIAMEAQTRGNRVANGLLNKSLKEIYGKYPWSQIPSENADGYSLQELADISQGRVRRVALEQLESIAETDSPVLAYLNVPAAARIYDGLGVEPPLENIGPSGHFVIVEKVTDRIVTLIDPLGGKSRWETSTFKYRWSGMVLMLPGQNMGIGDNVPPGLANSMRGGCCGSPPPEIAEGCKNAGNAGGGGRNGSGARVHGPGGSGSSGCFTCPTGRGAPAYKYGIPNGNVMMVDIPMWYPQAKGPEMSIRLDYNRTESHNEADYTNVNYYIFGNKWSFNFASYITEAPATNITVYLPTGWHEEYIYTNGGYIAQDIRNKNSFCITNGYAKLTTDSDKTAYLFSTNSQQLTRIEDRYGNGLNCQYDAGSGRLTNVVDEIGRYFSFQYNGIGLVTNIADQLGRNAGFEYSGAGDLVSMTDMGGYTTDLSYDTNSWVEYILYPSGSDITFEYADASELGYPYDNYDVPFRIRAVDSLDQTNEYFYRAFDSMGPVTMKDKAGNAWIYAHDADEPYPYIYMEAVNDAKYGTYSRRGDQWEARSYDAEGNHIETVISTNAYETRLGTHLYGTYNSNDIIKRFTFDTNGWVVGELWKTNKAVYASWSNVYDSAGNLIWYKDPLNNITAFAYDPDDNIIAITNALGHSIHMSYDIDGNLIHLTNALGYATEWIYNTNGQLTRVIYPDAASDYLSYDAVGRLYSFSNALSGELIYTHDDLDKITAIIFQDNTTNEYNYSCCGLDSIKDRLGNETIFGHDDIGRVDSVTDARGNNIGFEYDPLDNITAIKVDMGDYETTLAYNYISTNGFTRLAERVSPAGKAESYTYTFRGWLDERTDGNDKTTEYNYDALGRLVKINYEKTRDVDFSYDVLGNVTSVNNYQGQYSYAYNALSIPTNCLGEIHLSASGFSNISYRIKYFYDAAGNVTNLILAGLTGFTNVISTDYAYDSMNRLTMVSNQFASAVYQMDSAGRISSKTYGNGDVTDYTYDNESRLTTLITTSSTETVQGWYYEYNAMGMITDITNNTDSWTYEYDSIYQLTDETYNGTNTAWEYDQVGNCLSVSNSGGFEYYTYNHDNELTHHSSDTADWITVTGQVDPGTQSNKWYDSTASHGSRSVQVNTNDGSFEFDWVPLVLGTNELSVAVEDVTGNTYTQTVTFTKDTMDGCHYTYDGNGNRISKSDNTTNIIYSYDEENRLTNVTANGKSVLTCWYDGTGRRIAKREVVDSQTNKFMYVYSGWTVLAVFDGDGNLLEYYTRGTGIGGDIGTIVAAEHFEGSFTNGSFYYHANHRGDVTTVRSRGDTVLSVNYAASGETLASVGEYSSRYMFSSKERDSSVENYYYGLRYYSPRSMLWLSKDPIGLSGGLNQYNFCVNNPVNYIDPFGLEDINLYGPVTTDSAASNLRKSGANEITVGGHGAGGVIVDLRTGQARVITPAELTAEIKALPNYDPSKTVQVGTCEGAKGDNSAAEQISKLLPNPIKAATGKTVNGIAVDTSGRIVGSTPTIPDPNDKTSAWVTYQGGNPIPPGK